MNIPSMRHLRRHALARKMLIAQGTYQPRHAAPATVTYERTAWHAPRFGIVSSLMSSVKAISHALTHLRAAKPVRPPVLTPEPLVIPAPRPRGAHRAPGRAARLIGHRTRTARQAAPVRLSQRQQEALTRTEELVLKGCHAIRRHAEDVGKRRAGRLIPEVWSIA